MKNIIKFLARRMNLDMAKDITQWGEGPQQQEKGRSTFLYEPPTQKKMKQPLLTPLVELNGW
jgi:hypothetical protein